MIDDICGRFMTNPTFTHNYGLVGGEAGLAYLCSVMYELNNETKYKEWSNKIIMLLLFKNNNIPSSSLGYGKAGTYWLFLQLEKRGLLSGVDRFIKEETEILIEECKKMLTLNNLDYFEGALGILFALNENNKLSEELFLEFNSKIQENYSTNNLHRLDYKIYPEDSKMVSGFNLGTPHGLTGIVLFLLILKEKKQFYVDDSIRLIMDLFIYIKNNRMKGAIFPSHLRNNIEENLPSHLAWCYGNLSIIYAFKKAGVLLNNSLYENI